MIGEICDRLDGIALAIELAAARVRSMSPTQIRDRLDERFRLLTGSRRSIERHQTLRHAVQWSYDLLEPVEQSVVQQVSVFVGGFTLDAATAITELDEYEVLDILDSLVRKSLLYVDRSDSDVRYGMLETIRQFAEEALASTGTSDETRDRHASYYADKSDIAYAQLPTNDEPLAYRFIDSEITNLAAAFAWALTREQADHAVRIAANTHLLARYRLLTEALRWPEDAIGLARKHDHRHLPHLLAAAADAAAGAGRDQDAIRYGFEAVALNDDDRYDFDIFAYYIAGMAIGNGDGSTDEALSVLRSGADHPADSPARVTLLYLHILTYFFGVAVPADESDIAIERLKASSMPSVRAGGFWVQALIVSAHDVAAAIALCQQAIAADCGCRIFVESVRGFQIGLIAKTDDIDAALGGFAPIVATWQTSPGDTYLRGGMTELAAWLARLGYSDDAARLFGAISQGRLGSWTNPSAAGVQELAEAFTASFEAGAALDPRAAGEFAHELLAQVRADRLTT